MKALSHVIDALQLEKNHSGREPDPMPSLANIQRLQQHLKKLAPVMAGGAAATAWGQTAISVEAELECHQPDGSPSAEFKLAHKATFGYFSGLEQDIVNTGYEQWLDDQIDYQNLPGWASYEANLASINWYPTIIAPEGDPTFCQSPVAPNRQELVKARVHRAVESEAQLFERVVEFWTDHLNTWHFTPNLDNYKTFEDREDIRANALGRLYDLLYASATSPAMLVYLDGANNVVGNPNENYARELLELHTLGVDNCYDEATIQTLSLALTGWEVSGNPDCGNVDFNDNKHDNSEKDIFFADCAGLHIPQGSGQSELGMVIDFLTNPAHLGQKTVLHIAGKMANYFFSCRPPRRLLTEMWLAYRDAFSVGGNDIAAMIRVLLSKKWIHCSRPILKRPLHLLASCLRATGTAISDPGTEFQTNTIVGGFLTATGHRPYNWPAPDGYKNGCDEDYWGANQLERWNLGAKLFNYEYTGVDPSAAVLAALNAASDQALMDLIDSVVFGGFMDPFDKSRILSYLASSTYTFARVEALALTVASPGFQWF